MKKRLIVPNARLRPEKPHSRAENRAEKPKSESIIFGVLPVLEALRAGARRIDKILIADGAKEERLRQITALARQNGIPLNKLPSAGLERFLDGPVNHQGVIAFTASAEYAAADDLLDACGEEALMVVLDGVEDPRNLGAILRVAECAAVDGVFIPERRAVGLTETVGKSSAGAIEFVKVAKVPNLNRLIDEMKQRNIWVVGTSMDASMSYAEWDWTRPSALVLGGEGSGLHRLVAENCDVLVKIPMYGRIDSLNVSVAAGVILFEARRQRKLPVQSSEFRVTSDLNSELSALNY